MFTIAWLFIRNFHHITSESKIIVSLRYLEMQCFRVSRESLSAWHIAIMTVPNASFKKCLLTLKLTFSYLIMANFATTAFKYTHTGRGPICLYAREIVNLVFFMCQVSWSTLWLILTIYWTSTLWTSYFIALWINIERF